MSDSPKITKKTLAALEKVFAAEINGRLPFQSRAKIFPELVEQGMLQPLERRFGVGMLAVTVKGYQLTHLGRWTYCEICDGTDHV